MEHKTSREKAWTASSNKPKVNNNLEDTDILNLNLENDSFQEVEEVEEKVELSEEEKLEIRKKIAFLLVFVFIAFIIMLVILLFDPFSKKNNTENKKEVKIEEKQKLLSDYRDGNIDLGDDYIIQMVNEIKFTNDELLSNDVLSLYRNGGIEVKSMTPSQVLFLTTKTREFNKLVSKIDNTSEICNKDIILAAKDVDNLVFKRMNYNLIDHPNFKYNFTVSGSNVANIEFSYNKADKSYVGKCININKNPDSLLEQKFVSATKDGGYIYLTGKVVFVNKVGYYSDPEFKNLIVKGPESQGVDYFNSAKTYRYQYLIDGDNFYLTGISLQ